MDTNGGFHTNTETNEGDKGGVGGGKRKIALRVKTFSFFVFLRLVPLIFLQQHSAATFHTKLWGGRCDIDSPAMIRPGTHAFFTHWFCGCNSDICTRSAMTSAAWQWQSLPPLWNQSVHSRLHRSLKKGPNLQPHESSTLPTKFLLLLFYVTALSLATGHSAGGRRMESTEPRWKETDRWKAKYMEKNLSSATPSNMNIKGTELVLNRNVDSERPTRD